MLIQVNYLTCSKKDYNQSYISLPCLIFSLKHSYILDYSRYTDYNVVNNVLGEVICLHFFLI